LVHDGRLTRDELQTLRPIIGEVDPDVVSRWLTPALDPAEEAEIEAALDQWHGRLRMAVTLAHKGWAAGAAKINVDLVKRRAESAGAKAKNASVEEKQRRELAEEVPKAEDTGPLVSLATAPSSSSGPRAISFEGAGEGRKVIQATSHKRVRRIVLTVLLLIAV